MPLRSRRLLPAAVAAPAAAATVANVTLSVPVPLSLTFSAGKAGLLDSLQPCGDGACSSFVDNLLEEMGSTQPSECAPPIIASVCMHYALRSQARPPTSDQMIVAEKVKQLQWRK